MSQPVRSPEASATAPLRLGLIGDNIAASSAPRLHELVGRQIGRTVRYDRLVPAREGLGFPALFERAREEGYRGLNVTYPYKERAASLVRIEDSGVRALGAVNTVLFGPDGAHGHNTDHSGFRAAYRAARGERPPGTVALIGAGGVGRAIAFALSALEAPLRIVDREGGKAARLADEVRRAGGVASAHPTPEAAAAGADGLVNATPVGMVGRDGTPLAREAMADAAARGGWAFDAVYTPVDTRFARDAAASGLQVVSGWELFFWQGVHAARLFTGREPDVAALRAALLATG